MPELKIKVILYLYQLYDPYWSIQDIADHIGISSWEVNKVVESWLGIKDHRLIEFDEVLCKGGGLPKNPAAFSDRHHLRLHPGSEEL